MITSNTASHHILLSYLLLGLLNQRFLVKRACTLADPRQWKHDGYVVDEFCATRIVSIGLPTVDKDSSSHSLRIIYIEHCTTRTRISPLSRLLAENGSLIFLSN